ncbi:MAG: LLM class F420-dependent oxidoreductase [Dehalococcoidia bacterium]
MYFSFWPSLSNPWDEVLDASRHAAATGWDGVWVADHFMPNQADTSGPTSEVWTTLAALAVAVPRVRLGTLVCGNTYRNPAVLAKMAAGVDVISGGRAVLGIGAGWQENEHVAYGIPFYTIPERLQRLREACQIIRSLFTEEKTTFHGKHYDVVDAPLAPKPVQRPLPLLIGGGGEKVTLRIAARYADEWNTWGSPSHLQRKIGVLEQHCAAVGRDPRSIRRSAQALLFLGDEPDVKERAKAAAPRPVIAGNVHEVREVVRQYAAAGVDELIIPDFNLANGPEKRAVMDRFITEVAPAFR